MLNRSRIPAATRGTGGADRVDRVRILSSAAVLVAAVAVAAGCSPGSDGGVRWSGSVDTLPSGQVVVRNPANPSWPEGSEWQVVEELRIGSVDGGGPEVFGRINSFAVDSRGRIWVLDDQSQQLKVFDATGSHVRTIGRSGGGPGEFAQAVRVDVGPDGNIRVMDPSNNRLSVFDTAGAYLEGTRALGGFIMFPWPGGFDDSGRYYTPVPDTQGEFGVRLVRYDASLEPLDTLDFPQDPIERERFELRSGNSRMMAGVPFQGGITTRLSPQGTMWAMVTDQYRLFELDAKGDTLRTIIRDAQPLRVTDADREQAREDLEWFTGQGGQVDWTKIPAYKPLTRSFFFDDEGQVWVGVVTDPDDEGRIFDIFDPVGRYLGPVRLPFPLSTAPAPIVRDGILYGLTHDDLEVPFMVRARVVRPADK